MDPLSDILSLLKVRNIACGVVDAGEGLAIGFPAHEGIKCYAILSGQAWLIVEDDDPIRLETGSCFLLPRGRPFRLATDPAAETVDYLALIGSGPPGSTHTAGEGGACSIIGGFFDVDEWHGPLLLGMLPSIIQVESMAAGAGMRASLDSLAQELRDPQAGGQMMIEHLSRMMLVQALRISLAGADHHRTGLLSAIRDPRLSAALKAMHAEPARSWTVASLAALAGMSRTSFAVHFRGRLGLAPMQYLAHWRVLLGAERLVSQGGRVATIALALGYGSESAFSSAFKRVMGHSPRRHLRLNTRRDHPQPHSARAGDPAREKRSA